MKKRDLATDCDKGCIWIDSGASTHMVKSADCLYKKTTISPKVIVLGTGDTVLENNEGEALLCSNLRQNGRKLQRKVWVLDVLFVPDLEKNFVYVTRICDE